MATDRDAGPLRERLFIALSSLVAVGCAVSLFYVMHQINLTRLAMQEDGIDIFNYVMQNDRNTDLFAFALLDYQRSLQTSSTPDAVDKSEYLQRFDILYSAFRQVDDRWLGSHRDLPEAADVARQARGFIDRYEPLMHPSVDLDAATLEALSAATRQLSDDINSLGHWHYQNVSWLTDRRTARLDNLTRAFWISGLLLLLAGTILSVLLVRATRRMSAFYEQSRRARDQLAKALEEVNSGDNERRAQNRFIAAASHDLRQPLHALGLYLTALRGHVATDKGLDILASVHRSSEALNQLLNSLLDISKLDAGVVEIDERAFCLDALLDQLLQTFRPDADERGLSFTVARDGYWVDTDRVLFDRILRNLLSNALAYTHRGSVRIDAIAETDHILLRVTDTGLGIPAIEQQAVFNEYYQLNNPERDRSKGLGLGLSIVKRLTRLLDLDLHVESQPGRGSVFEVRVRRATPPALRSIAPAPDPGSDSEMLAGLSILVIDDERDILDGMDVLLSSFGAQVIRADSASQATGQLIEQDVVPDLVLADYRLRDGQRGNHAIERVRDELNEEVPAMIITGDTSPERIKEATASGFKLLHKPVVAEELFAAIRRLVEVETP